MLKHKFLVIGAMTAAIGLVACSGSSTSNLKPPVTVSLIGMNDLHGNLQAPTGSSGNVTVADPANPAGTKVSVGGVAYMATLIASLKAQNPNGTAVVAAGDLVGATPLNSALFHDEPTIDALNLIGLDITSVGNHEFDKGPTELRRLQNGGCFPRSSDNSRGIVGVDTCMTDGKFGGAKFQYLAANVTDTATGKTLFPSYAIRTLNGEKIAFIGMTLKDTPSVVTPAGVAGLKFAEEVATVNSLVPEILAQNVSAIVVLVHQGGFTTATTINDKSCPGLNGDIVSITDRLDPLIDVVISGHTHTEYVCTRPDGKLLTQAGFYGRLVSKIDLQINPNTHRVISKSANNIANVNDIVIKDAGGKVIPLPAGYTASAKNAAMDALVTRYAGLTAPITGQVIGNMPAAVDKTVNTAGESKMGDIVADIYLNGSTGAAYGSKPGQIGFANAGGVRASLPNAVVTYGDLFTVMPFGNNLVTVDLTGTQILRLLEQQWEAGQPAGGRIMQVSSSFTYSWDASKPEGAAAGTGNRVVAGSMKLNGTPIDLTKTYRVTVNNFMSTGGDNFTVLKSGTNLQAGDIDIDAGVAYFKSLGTVPTPSQSRIVRVN
jgi:5'-nucleotidase